VIKKLTLFIKMPLCQLKPGLDLSVLFGLIMIEIIIRAIDQTVS